MFVTRNNINSGLLSVIKHTSATFVTCRIKFSSPNMYVRIGDHLPGSTYVCLEVNCSSLQSLKRTLSLLFMQHTGVYENYHIPLS